MSETERTMLDRLNIRYAECNGNGIRYTRAEHVKNMAGHDAGRICDYGTGFEILVRLPTQQETP